MTERQPRAGAGLAVAVLILGCGIQALAGYSHGDASGHAWGCDDAYISYRYARNLYEGRGLVYNVGDRVEGYSNLLYVLLLAPGFFVVDGKDIYWYSFAINLIFSCGALVIFYLHLRAKFPQGLALSGAFLFAAFPAVWVWTASGLETSLVLLLQIAAWVLTEQVIEESRGRDVYKLCVVVALLGLARADGFVVPLLAAGYLLVKGRQRAAVVAGSVLAMTIVAIVLWRMAYYGYPLPNSVYAKVTGSLLQRIRAGVGQLIRETPYNGLLVYILGIFAAMNNHIVCAFRGGSGFLRELRFDHVLALGLLCYFAAVGGDAFNERFLLVLMCLGFSATFSIKRLRTRLAEAGWTLVPLMLIFHMLPLLMDGRYAFRLGKYDRWLTLGKYLSKVHKGEILAIDGGGKVPYVSGLTTIDMLGLNDRHIGRMDVAEFRSPGHDKFDVEYVLSRKPDLIAAWLAESGLDLQWGLNERRYMEAGYRLLYLVNSTAENREENIVGVFDLGRPEILDLVKDGYRYGVLASDASGKGG